MSAATCARASSTAARGLLAERVVRARRVAEALGEVRQHRVDAPRGRPASSRGGRGRSSAFAASCLACGGYNSAAGPMVRFIMLEALVLAALVADGPAPDRGEALRDAAPRRRRREGHAACSTRACPSTRGAAARADARSCFAAGKGRLEVVRLLVERGADVNARETFFGQTPLSSRSAACAETAPWRSRCSCCRRAPTTRPRRSTRPSSRATSSWRGRRSRPDAWSRSSWRRRAWPRTRRRRSRRAPGAARGGEGRAAEARAVRGSRRTRSKKYAGRYRGGPDRGDRRGSRRPARDRGEPQPELVRRADRRGPVRDRGRRRGGRASGGRAGTIEGLSVNRDGRRRALRRRHRRSRAAQARRRRPRSTTAAPAAKPRGPGRSSAARSASGIGDGQGVPADLGRREGRERALQDAAARALAQQPDRVGRPHLRDHRRQREGRQRRSAPASTATARRSTTSPSTRSGSTRSTRGPGAIVWEREVVQDARRPCAGT